MKTLKWFKAGDLIPDEGRYIKSETRRENVRYYEVHPMLAPDVYWDSVEYHLYEIPDDQT